MRKKQAALMMALGLAGILGTGQASQSLAINKSDKGGNTKELQANLSQRKKKSTVVNEVGGIPLVTYSPAYGLSPKEYGLRYGNGGSKRSNRLRYSHNAKLKRRIAA